MDHLLGQLGLTRYTLYMQDYGGPVGMRLAVAHPERVQAMVIQNAVSSEDGLGPAWDVRRRFWHDRAAYEDEVISAFLSLATTQARHVGSSPNRDRYDPNEWLRRVRPPLPAGPAGDPVGPVLRLPDQRRRLPGLAGLVAGA